MRSFTVAGPATRTNDAVEVPVVGGLVIVLADGSEADRLVARCRRGARLTCRVADAGDGWWLAAAARVDGGDPLVEDTQGEDA